MKNVIKREENLINLPFFFYLHKILTIIYSIKIHIK